VANATLPETVPARLDQLPPLIPKWLAARTAWCSTRTVDRAIAAGRLRALRPGGRVLIQREDFLRWLGLEVTA
jgi:excisionase family DNA binding protein